MLRSGLQDLKNLPQKALKEVQEIWYGKNAYKHLKSETQDDPEQIKENIEALEKAVQQITKSNKENEQLKETLEVLDWNVYTHWQERL